MLGIEKVYVRGPSRRAPEENRVRWIERVKRGVLINSNGCWMWQGPKDRAGYGTTTFGKGHHIKVHRGMFMFVNNLALQKAQCVCHACDEPACCNPDHLWLGSMRDNSRDSRDKGRHAMASKTRCKRGHPFSHENTYVGRDGRRNCRVCQQLRARKSKALRAPEVIK